MRQNRVHLSARLSALAAQLLALEKQRTGDSEGEIISRCILESLAQGTPEAIQLVRDYAANDPTFRAIAAVVGNSTAMPKAKAPPLPAPAARKAK
jgi:hypothetical protein